MIHCNVALTNKLGLHMYVATLIVKTVNRFVSRVTLAKSGRRRDARSVLDLMMLEAPVGTALTIEADGTDAEQAVASLVALFESRFGEE